MKKLGIVAGRGTLPLMLIKACQEQKRPFYVLALKDHAEPELYSDDLPLSWIRLGDVGKAIQIAHENKVEEIIMIGAVRRPTFSELRPDWRGVKFFAKAGIKALGDDGILKAAIEEIEKEGFSVVGADSVLKDCLSTLGLYGKVKPDKQALKDIAKGYQVAKILGQADVGQSVVIADGLVLSVEAIEGTDALIMRSASLARSKVKPVLVKVKKPKQETRADLPTIGTQTVINAFSSGFAGIAVEAGSAFVVDREAVVKKADELGLFVIGIDETCLKNAD
ncbi:MAG: UDP-2,3-diacylglucosamine diphosphatase LpxI [Alphaproteobacteria bacterium]|nr:UDP-2,3-diacylglucosamine diphosphatase LpxI [Alphaproteobacteria bacterium]